MAANFGNNISVLFMSLILLASAQRTSNNLHKDIDIQELARQNKITKQILEAFFQKRLGLSKSHVRPPSIDEILPLKVHEERPNRTTETNSFLLELQEQFGEDDNLQSVESEQIASIYDEGRKKYPGSAIDAELENFIGYNLF